MTRFLAFSSVSSFPTHGRCSSRSSASCGPTPLLPPPQHHPPHPPRLYYLVTSSTSSTTTTGSSNSSGEASTVRVYLRELGPWHSFAGQHADLLVLHAAAAFSDNAFLPLLAIATAAPYRNSSDSSSSSSGGGSSGGGHSSKEQSVVFLSGSPSADDSSEAPASLDSVSAFRSALRTINAWAKSTPRLKNIPVFFLSTPGHHFASSKDPAVPHYKNIWKAKWSGKGTCDSVTVPLEKPHRDKERAKVIDSELADEGSRSSSRVQILPVGQVSAARADAHISKWHGDLIDGIKQDCVNFCLPGVPDSWNELMLQSLHTLLW
ncbi:unnamed protein product [Closterium sp. NIES-54]